MILGIGTDIIENQRINRAIEQSGERFLKKVFTKIELEICTGGRGIKVQSLAARFAGKEAVAKALGTGIGVVGWKEIEITANSLGAPDVELKGKALNKAREMGVSQIKISLSHSVEYSIAFVVLTE